MSRSHDIRYAPCPRCKVLVATTKTKAEERLIRAGLKRARGPYSGWQLEMDYAARAVLRERARAEKGKP